MGIKSVRIQLDSWMKKAREQLSKELGRPCTENELTELFVNQCLRQYVKAERITDGKRPTDIKWC